MIYGLCYFVYPFSTGSSHSDKVHQTPAHMYNKPGEQVNIRCSHSDDSYNQIHWYKQVNKQLQPLGYVYLGNGNPEPDVNVTIGGGAAKGDNCTLTIKEVDLNSSAV